MKNLIAISIFTLMSFNAFANDNAKRLTELLINEDIAVFKTDGESIIGEKIPTVSVSALNEEFSNDLINYEKTYDQKLVNIIAEASDVKKDLNGNPYIIASDEDPSEFVVIKLKNKDDMQSIIKGSELDLICLGIKDNKFPSLENCVTTDSYLQNFLERIMNNISQLKEGDVPKDFFEAIYLSFKEFDIQNPNRLDEKKLENNPDDMNAIIKIVTDSIKDDAKQFTMPHP